MIQRKQRQQQLQQLHIDEGGLVYSLGFPLISNGFFHLSSLYSIAFVTLNVTCGGWGYVKKRFIFGKFSFLLEVYIGIEFVKNTAANLPLVWYSNVTLLNWYYKIG